ncbi:MAG: pilus assembly protein [Acidimicrobiales bacterium]|nr:pilus assembly protein [Acidimicrobiales bacterium]
MTAVEVVIGAIAGGSVLVSGRLLGARRTGVGRAQARRGVGVPVGVPVGRFAVRPPSARSVRQQFVVVLLAVAVVSGIAAGPPGSLLSVLAVVGARLAIVRSQRGRAVRRRADDLPELIDLFVLAASAGLPVGSALSLIAARAPPALASALGRSAAATRHGASVDDALLGLDRDLGAAGHELVSALRDAVRTGSPLLPMLREVSATARDRRRRQAEERIRRLPVTMLFPLACCILPAAVLLALVPVLVASLGSLGP